MGPDRMGQAAYHPGPRQVAHLLCGMALLFRLGHYPVCGFPGESLSLGCM